MFVGVGASRVRDLFEQGKKHAPCIIFIDEIDAVGRHRGAGLGGGHDEREQTLNQLLVEMDGFESNEGVIIIAATNRPDVLDPAILRPGRFDRRITVPRPDVRGREEILRVHAKRTPLSPDVDLEIHRARHAGLLGRRPREPRQRGRPARRAAGQGRGRAWSTSSWRRTRSTWGPSAARWSSATTRSARPPSTRRVTRSSRCSSTHHDPVHKVTIIPRGPALGVTWYLPKDDRHNLSKEQAESSIAVALGGRIAEEIIFGQMTTGAGNDIEKATEIARKMVCEWGMSEKLGPLAYGKKEESIFLGRDYGQRTQDYSEQTAQEIDQEVRAIVQRQYVRVKDHLTQSRDKLQRLADALIERETLDAEEIAAVLEGRELPKREKVDHPDVRREGQGEQREAPRREHLRRPAEARHQRLLRLE